MIKNSKPGVFVLFNNRLTKQRFRKMTTFDL
jgi:hypothetical protein